jgi:glycosyltransferase involved in cell wall biosynthesis
LFSIIIPIYNKAKYVSKAIQSVLDQTFCEWELIVVNDGSTDGSEVIVEKFQKRCPDQIRLVHQLNQGVSAARNYGVSLASYDWIAFLDADDWWEPDFLAEISVVMDSYPEALMYASDYYYVKRGIKRVDNKGIPAGFDRGYVDFIRTYSKSFVVLVNCSFVVLQKKAFLELGGFPEGVRLGEDLLLWLRFAKLSSLGYVNRPLSNSFQDGEISNRALGWKVYPPDHHFIFQMESLEQEYPTHPDLKFLLDGLRVRALWKYRLSGQYLKEYQSELAKVDWSKQPSEFKKYYTWPVTYWRVYWTIRRVGSRIKKNLLKF